MGMKKYIVGAISIFAMITLGYFVLLLYRKIDSWVGNSNWTIIVIIVLLLIFAASGIIGWKQIKKKFG